MASHLANYFQRTRNAQRISLAELARQAGYRNTSKGCRRIMAFENTGRMVPDLLVKLAAALGIEGQVVDGLIDADRQAWEE
jgi:transcriptional regulator with XRE-family HTH domain